MIRQTLAGLSGAALATCGLALPATAATTASPTDGLLGPLLHGILQLDLPELLGFPFCNEDESTCAEPVDLCDTGCWTLGNKVGGLLEHVYYGLCLDGLLGDPDHHWTFDFEAPGADVRLSHDGAGQLALDALVYGGIDHGGWWDQEEHGWLELHLVFQGATCQDGRLVVLAADGGLGYGTAKWLKTGELVCFDAVANAEGELFVLDGLLGADARAILQLGEGLFADLAVTVDPSDLCLTAPDCDGDGTPDALETDCNGDGIPDDCQKLDDTNENGTPDVCEPPIEPYCVPNAESPYATEVSCPCSEANVTEDVSGCRNSTGLGAALTTTGSASVSAGDLQLHVQSLPQGQPGLFIAGTTADATPFRKGILCIAPQVSRIGKIPNSPGGEASFPGEEYPSLATLVDAEPGDTHYFQFWYRDAGGPCGNGANLSNGVRVTWGE